MMLAFRNIDVDPEGPVELWGFEGLLAAIDRGEAGDWRRIAHALRSDPWGPVARLLEESVLEAASDRGVAGAMRALIDLQRQRADASERDEVSRELARLVLESGLSQAAFARRMATSRTRLNTYLTGRVVPAATVLVRARRVSEAASVR